MRKLLAKVLAVAVALTLLPFGWQQAAGAVPLTGGGSCGANVTWSLQDGVLTISGTGPMDASVPWKASVDSIQTLIVSPGVTELGCDTCSGCSNLSSVSLPDTLKCIDARSFMDCTSLRSIELPEGVTQIFNKAFENCTSLAAVTIPSTVSEMGSAIFENCTGLTDVVVSEGISGLGVQMFSHCTSLSSVRLPRSLGTLKDSVFEGCTSLHQLEFKNAGLGIGYAAFANSGLQELTLPDNVTVIPDYAFYKCKELRSITLPSNLQSIGEFAFAYCAALGGVEIPDAVTAIRQFTFCGCTELRSVGYPARLTEVGMNAFADCEKLESAVLPDSVTHVGTCAFKNCASLRSAALRSAQDIPSEIFSGCSSLTSIALGSGTGGIWDKAFYGCSSLREITLPENVESLSGDIFGHCTSLSSINVSPENAGYCSVDGVLFNKSKTAICRCPEGRAGTYVIPDGVIHVFGFTDCTKLTDVTFPDSVTEIGDKAFSGCTALKSITLTDSLTEFGNRAFMGCGSLQSAMIGNGIQDIPDSLFALCASLTSVAISNSVTAIQASAFSQCSSLTDVYYSGSAEEWSSVWVSLLNDDLQGATMHYDSTAVSQRLFQDIRSYDYFRTAVLWAVKNGVTSGTTKTTFSPQDPCTRGQVVTFLWRASGLPEPTRTRSPFDDAADSGVYYYKAVLWAAESGITSGTTETTFSPDDTVTRAQFVTFLWRAAGEPAPSSLQSPFIDVQDVNSYYYKVVLWAAEQGVTVGVGGGGFGPERTCTRGQVVTFLYRYLA